MRKLIAGLLASVLILNSTATVSYAVIENLNSKQEIQAQENAIIPLKLEKEIKASLAKVYGTENVEVIYSNILSIAKKAKEERSSALIEEDLNRPTDWYKDEVIYMFYANHFGVKNPDKSNTFKDDIQMLDYLKTLGVTTIYILPFVDSPMEDAGFDIRNPRGIRQDLGGMFEFQKFISAARQKGFKIKADLVLNHFSDQHEWFQQALKGDISKLDYFVVRDQMPEYTKYKDPKLGWVAEYKEPSGKTSKRRIIFPEITENNYRKVTINNKDYYFYHTFYPFQLDINWKNPKVLYYNLETIAFWANQGVDIFRMDAIPYLIKEDGTNAENLEETHRIIKILSAFIQAIAPRSVIQAEACQMPNKILPYFGTEQNPDSASWAIFLRVHDELTLEMVNEKTREILFEDLAPKGAAFRKGFGVSGRMANFLDNNPDRIGMAFSILMSLPGIPIIYYGDEIGIQNNFANANKSAKMREAKQKKDKDVKNKVKMLSYFDSRDINRGPITQKTFEDAVNHKGTYNNRVYERAKQLIKVRKQYPVITRGSFVELKTKSPEVFAYVRATDTDRVVVINNLSDKKIKATVIFTDDNFGKKEKDIYLKNLLTDKMVRARVENKELTVRLNAYDAMWLKM